MFYVCLDAARMQAYHISLLETRRAIQASNVKRTARVFSREDRAIRVEAGPARQSPDELGELVAGAINMREKSSNNKDPRPAV